MEKRIKDIIILFPLIVIRIFTHFRVHFVIHILNLILRLTKDPSYQTNNDIFEEKKSLV